MTLTKPAALKLKDKIACVAPAGPFEYSRFEKGIQLLENMGFYPVFRDDVFSKENYLAGCDNRRLEELHQFIEDREVKAIMAIRGGYGTMRLFKELDFKKIANNPKAWFGFSDISALFSAIYAKSKLVTLHGPQVLSLPDADKEVQDHWFNLVTGKNSKSRIFPENAKTLHVGKAKGKIFTINLAMLASLTGTPFVPDVEGHILAIEDVGEWPYRLDRMLTQLELAGVFDKISGLVLGQFTFFENAPENSCSQLFERVGEIVKKYDIPCICDCPFGHIDNNYPIASGVEALLDADSATLEYLETVFI